MDIAYHVATALSIVVFLYYGLSCLFSNGMAAEFKRFGLERVRRLTGTLEVLGALGLLVGYFIPYVAIAASGGLALLMALGLVTRIRVRDPLVQMLPALILALMNLYILAYAVRLEGIALWL